MATRPAAYPYWTDGSSLKVTQPDGASALQGFTAGEPPPFQYVNYLFWIVSSWIQYLDQLTNTNFNGALIRLINGGLWSFNAETGELAWSATANLSVPSLPDAANSLAAGNVTLPDGYDAYLVANLPTQSLGDTNPTLYPDEIVNMNFTGNIQVGDVATGPGVPSGTTVLGVAPTSVLLSQNVTSTNSQANYTFAPAATLSMQVAPNSSLIPTATTILVARRAAGVVYLGVNCAQMVLRDGETKPLIGTGYFSVYQAPAGQNLSAGTLVYASPGSSDGGRTAGALYPLDTSMANQAVRGNYAGVVITAATTGNPATIVYSGFYQESSLTPGVTYYADPTTPGGITATQPSGGGRIVPIGYAVTGTLLLLTGAAIGVEGPSTFPVFYNEYPVDTGDHQNFTLSYGALSAGAVFNMVDGGIVAGAMLTTPTNVRLPAPLAPGQRLFTKYLLSGQAYLSAGQEIPTNPSGDRKTWIIQGTPVNQAATFFWVDGEIIDNASFTLTIGSQNVIVLNTALALGQDAYVGYFSPVAANGGVTGGTNLGSGIPVFAGTSGTDLEFQTLIAGTGIAITEASGQITITATGGGGGGSIEVHGSFAAPVVLTPASGITPTTAPEQAWWVTPSGSTSGVNPITSTPQLAPGTTIGQRVTFFGITNGSGGFLGFANGNGIYSPGGDFQAPSGQALVYMWNGTAWQIVSNAI